MRLLVLSLLSCLTSWPVHKPVLWKWPKLPWLHDYVGCIVLRERYFVTCLPSCSLPFFRIPLPQGSLGPDGKMSCLGPGPQQSLLLIELGVSLRTHQCPLKAFQSKALVPAVNMNAYQADWCYDSLANNSFPLGPAASPDWGCCWPGWRDGRLLGFACHCLPWAGECNLGIISEFGTVFLENACSGFLLVCSLFLFCFLFVCFVFLC